jgi:hypothetical protein
VWTDSGGSGSGGGSNNAGAVATQAGGWSWSHGPVNATGASAIVVEDEEVKSTKMSSSGGSDRSSDPNGIMLVLKLLKQLCEGHHLPAQVGCIPEQPLLPLTLRGCARSRESVQLLRPFSRTAHLLPPIAARAPRAKSFARKPRQHVTRGRHGDGCRHASGAHRGHAAHAGPSGRSEAVRRPRLAGGVHAGPVRAQRGSSGGPALRPQCRGWV